MDALEVLWADDFLCAINKPAGWVVHRGWAQDDEVLVDRLSDELSRHVYPCHRLDRQTSGVLLVALEREAARLLNAAFASQQVQKRYVALVRGRVQAAGCIDHPLPNDGVGPRMPALSYVHPLVTRNTRPRETTWVCVEPKSGRTHQVRRHLKHISHPIIGDANYGKGALNRAFRDAFGLHRMALHAASLCFRYPNASHWLEISAPVPPDLAEPLLRMGYAPASIEVPRGVRVRDAEPAG